MSASTALGSLSDYIMRSVASFRSIPEPENRIMFIDEQFFNQKLFANEHAVSMVSHSSVRAAPCHVQFLNNKQATAKMLDTFTFFFKNKTLTSDITVITQFYLSMVPSHLLQHCPLV